MKRASGHLEDGNTNATNIILSFSLDQLGRTQQYCSFFIFRNMPTWSPKKVLLLFLICISVSILFFIVLKNQSPKQFWTGWTDADFIQEGEREDGYKHPWLDGKVQKNLLDGLLPDGFDEKSCRSRYQSGWLHKGLTQKPSPYLISRLRSYEALHKRCAPGTEGYHRAVSRLNPGSSHVEFNRTTDCKYVVWFPRDGLGNRIITLASTFLYALLNNRVMLVDDRDRISHLLCEPFLGGSWLAPKDFAPLKSSRHFNKHYDMSYGNMLKKGNSSDIMKRNGWVYLHVVHNYNDDDQRLFCDDADQIGLQDVTWHVLKSNVYFVPSLFLMPSFQEELNRLFPDKETVFHFLGRYLFHPTDTVWRAITKYYNHILANADEKIGIQVRVFDTEPDPFEHYKDQILKCLHKENLLPLPARKMNETSANLSPGKSKTVLVTSLSPRYYETLKNMYSDSPTTTTGEVVRVFQPTHEVEQHTNKEIHNMKAWAEMYLLSLMDELVTSSKSTFGYVSQGLGGMKPWILYRPEEYRGDPDPPCQRARSMEPCFQAPPGYDCKTRNRVDLGRIVPYIRHCEDMQWTWGLKLYGKDGEPSND